MANAVTLGSAREVLVAISDTNFSFRFRVSNVTKPIVSAEGLFQAGCTTVISKTGVRRTTIFSSFLPLVLFAVRDVRDCHSPFPVICIAFCGDGCWLKASQSVCTHEVSLACFVTRKGFIATIFVVIIFLTFCQ